MSEKQGASREVSSEQMEALDIRGWALQEKELSARMIDFGTLRLRNTLTLHTCQKALVCTTDQRQKTNNCA
jgi:hypothetical protein